MNTSIGVRIIERILHEGFAGGNTDLVDELCSPDVVEHQFGMAGVGAEAIAKIKEGIRTVHTAFPDLHFTVEDTAVVGDTAWVRAVGRGTHTGPFFGPPTGRPIELTVIDVARVVDGRIVEHWGVPDRFEIMVRTGKLDALAAAHT